MNIFLSYPSSSRDKIESVCYELQAEGHEVFFDKEDLSPGRGYNERIRSAIESSDLFIFMITPESVAKGKYTLTELKIAARKWPNPVGHVLPVMLEPTDFDQIPAYLKAVTVLSPEGNLTAEVAMEIADLNNKCPDILEIIETETYTPKLSYRPLEVRFGAGHDNKYPISITDSPTGKINTQLNSFNPKSLEDLLPSTANIEETLRLTQIYLAERSELLLPTADNAQKIGEQLYNLLFTSPIQTCLDESLRSIDPQRGQGLRFLINTTEAPDLARLPWEFLYNPEQDDFLFTDIMKPVVRWLNVNQPPPSLIVQPPLRLLIAIASPADRPGLSVGKEIARLGDALSDLIDKGLVEIQCLKHTTLEQLDSALLQTKPHVLHFIGHGDFSDNEGMIILEANRHGGAEPISGRRLGILLRNHLGSLRFVFLNSCLGATTSHENPFGGVAQSLIQRGIPAVIAMQFPVPDLAAVSLAQHFYRYLAAGQPVDAAITSTRAFMFAKGYNVEWGAPVLYMRTPDGRLFDIDDSFTLDEPFSANTLDEANDFTEQTIHREQPIQVHKSTTILPKSSNLKWLPILIVLLALALVAGLLVLWPIDREDNTIQPQQVDPIKTPEQQSIINAKAIENTYRDALSSLENGNTSTALDKLHTAKQKDPDQRILSQHPGLRTELANAFLAHASSELPTGDLDLAQKIVDMLRKIEPIKFQNLQNDIFSAIQHKNQIDHLFEQAKLAFSIDEASIAEQLLKQLLDLDPNHIQARELYDEVKTNSDIMPTSGNGSDSYNNDSLQPGQPYKIVQGDSLWALANRVYGNPRVWPDIYAANRNIISNPDIIYPGQKLILPVLTGIDQHRVKKGDSLWHIAGNVYGDPFRWPEIFHANYSIINNPDLVFPNQMLIIPNNKVAKTNE